MSDEEMTGREVLDGTWVTGWEAIARVEEYLKRHAIFVPMATGEILARMAVSGYLPTITNEVSHSVPIADSPSKPEDDVETPRPRDKGWRLVPATFWAATFGHCTIPDKHVQHAECDFKHGAGTAVFTTGKLEWNAKLHEVGNDGGFYLLMVRNILFYEDGLYAAGRFAQGHADEDDLYDYKALDLSRLNLPGELPLEARERQLARWSKEEAGLDGGAPRSSGRAGGKNGEPIASLTIKLMTLPMEELSRYTADAAGAELQQFFVMSGVGGRNADNCKKDAAGVLRAVRAARGVK